MQVIRKHLYGGLNADDDFEFVGENQWINSSGIRILSTDKGATAKVESVGGTTMLFNSLPAGTNYCMGGCVDERYGLLLWFNYNSNGNHGIYAYRPSTSTSFTVLLNSQVDSGLSISKDVYIHSAHSINGILYWVDAGKVQRKANVRSLINMNHPGTFTGVFTFTSPVKESTISLYKPPPPKSPTFVPAVATSPSISFNLIKDGVFRFAWRYVYRDYETSVLSQWTGVANRRYDEGLGYNSINVFVGATRGFITEDVKYVDLVVQHADTGKTYVIKTWDADIDSAAIAASNAGTPLTYNFKNNEAGILLDQAYKIKTQDNIPVYSETLTAAKNRLFLGNNTIGYTSPEATSLTVSAQTYAAVNAVGGFGKKFKSDATYKFGVVFFDKFMRRCGVVQGPSITSNDLEFYIPNTIKLSTVTLTLSNAAALTEIPDWAHYYRVVKSQNLNTDNFFQGYAAGGKFKYAYKDPETGVITYQDTLGTTPYGVALSIEDSVKAGIGYSFTKDNGDVLKIYLNTGSLYYKKTIIDADGLYVIVPWDPMFTGNISTKQCVYEIFTPKLDFVDDIYFEYEGANNITYAINNPGTNTRAYSQLSVVFDGDIWMIERWLNTSTFIRVEAMSVSNDYWTEWIRDEVTPNIVDRIGQKHVPTSIVFSNVLIPGSKSNGMSSFEFLNETILDAENGPIRKLELASKIQQDGSVMLAICEQDTVSCYLGEQEIFDTQASAFIAKADSVIGNTKALRGGIGTKNPESVFEYNGLIYWWDITNGYAVQYSSNGLFPVSKNKFTRPANLISKKYASLSIAQIEALGSRPFIIGGIDPLHKEVLFTVPSTESVPKGTISDFSPAFDYPYDIYSGKGKTLVYKHENDLWCGSYPYEAEKFMWVGNDLYGLKAGVLYKFNSSSHGNFFGVTYKPNIQLSVSTGAISTFLSIGVESNKAPFFAHFRTEEPNVQSSGLALSQFTSKEGVWYASIMRDRLSDNTTGSADQRQIRGDKLFGRFLLLHMEFDVSIDPLSLKFIDTGFIINKGHLQLKQQ